ncbi:helix-turn-helix transcriptional regulator [Flavobacterium oncorhynchi]|uniref:helix-turn-helix transcriptional regulator n=1 Tax=Flavobacterium oncorhynchi TaxID=728056 RepID=UPI00351A332E
MKTITHQYNTSNSWIEILAKAMGGSIEGNFIKGNNETYQGTHFILPIEEGIKAMLIDTTYKETTRLKYRNKNTNFIGLYFYLTNIDVDFMLNEEAASIGKLKHNLSIVDSKVDMDYTVQKGTRIYVICILFDKANIKEYFSKISKTASTVIDNILDNKRNATFRLDRMNIESLILINDFRKIAYDNSLYEIYFKGLVYGLTASYLKQLETKESIIEKTFNVDVKNIIASKAMLQNNIDDPFPGISFLAEQIGMSPSKYKKLFVKISGVNPGTYFYNNKLNKAKELLETGKFTVNEVAHKLNYANVSYLSKRFHQMYGVFPKEYQSLL